MTPTPWPCAECANGILMCNPGRHCEAPEEWKKIARAACAAPLPPWEPHVYMCAQCAGLMMSERPGYFSSCDCGESYVDETRYYGRMGGYAVPLESES